MRLVSAAFILASLAVAGCDKPPVPQQGQRSVPVRVATVAFTPRTTTLTLSGTVQTRTLAELAFRTLSADADGVITALPVQVGQVVASGQTVASLAHTAETEVVVDVPENRLPDVRAARQIDIALWAEPSHPLRGRVREIGAQA